MSGAHHSVQVRPENSLQELVLSLPEVVLGVTLRSSGSAPSTLIHGAINGPRAISSHTNSSRKLELAPIVRVHVFHFIYYWVSSREKKIGEVNTLG